MISILRQIEYRIYCSVVWHDDVPRSQCLELSSSFRATRFLGLLPWYKKFKIVLPPPSAPRHFDQLVYKYRCTISDFSWSQVPSVASIHQQLQLATTYYCFHFCLLSRYVQWCVQWRTRADPHPSYWANARRRWRRNTEVHSKKSLQMALLTRLDLRMEGPMTPEEDKSSTR